jgi:hypothetical protein
VVAELKEAVRNDGQRFSRVRFGCLPGTWRQTRAEKSEDVNVVAKGNLLAYLKPSRWRRGGFADQPEWSGRSRATRRQKRQIVLTGAASRRPSGHADVASAPQPRRCRMRAALRYTLVSDGPTDDALLPLLNWLLQENGVSVAIEPQFANLSQLPQPPRGLADRIKMPSTYSRATCSSFTATRRRSHHRCAMKR